MSKSLENLKTQPQNQKQKSKILSLPPLVARLATAAVALPILFASILMAKLAGLFVLIGAIAMMIGLYEFWLLARRQQVKPDVAAGYLAAAALFTVFYFTQPGKLIDFEMIYAILLVFTISALTAAMLRGAPFDKMILSVGVTLLGVLYVVLLGGHLIAIRMGFSQELSRHLLSFFFFVIMSADVAAYAGGSLFGSHKLAPAISPGKTWEGAIAGMMISLLAAALAHFWFFRELPLKIALPLAAVMNVLSVLGDLTESALKRSAGAKDTAKILPGHGGILDRLDSLLFNAPVIYYFARLYFK